MLFHKTFMCPLFLEKGFKAARFPLAIENCAPPITFRIPVTWLYTVLDACEAPLYFKNTL